MKYFVFAAIALFTITLGCKKKSEPILETRNFEYQVAQNIGSSTFKIIEISDNRCPINADCITAGKASILLEVKQNDKQKDLKLCIGGDCNSVGITDNVEFKMGNVRYKVILKKVDPFPNLSNALLPKTVVLEVTRG